MNEFVMEQLIYVLRLVSAALCGGLIGYERQSRKKTAGTRTHVIIAVAAAAMMIISKYGFNDVLGDYVKLDPSRVAAGIVTAVGFIGSGIIIFRNNNVNGITTSAGIWATVGVGMAMGAGMYVLGAVSTMIVMIVELFLGRKGYFTGRYETKSWRSNFVRIRERTSCGSSNRRCGTSRANLTIYSWQKRRPPA